MESYIHKTLGYRPKNIKSLAGMGKNEVDAILFGHIQRHAVEMYGRKNLERKKLHSHVAGSAFATTDRPMLRDSRADNYVMGYNSDDPRSVLAKLRVKNKV